jgi:hypothetical protein
MLYLYELIELLVALLVLTFLFARFKKWILTDFKKDKIETIKIVTESEEELAKKIEPISKKNKQNKDKIDSYIKEGEKLNG